MTRRRANTSRIPPRAAMDQTVEPENGAPRIRTGHQMTQRWHKSLSAIPRWGRILIVAVMSLAVTLVIFPQVDTIYLTYFFNKDTIIIPAYVSAGIGLMMYVAGWFLVVGSTANKPHDQVSGSPVLLWYIGMGVLALVVCTGLLLYGLMLTAVVAS